MAVGDHWRGRFRARDGRGRPLERLFLVGGTGGDHWRGRGRGNPGSARSFNYSPRRVTRSRVFPTVDGSVLRNRLQSDRIGDLRLQQLDMAWNTGTIHWVNAESNVAISELHEFLSRAYDEGCYSESQYRNHQTTLRLLLDRVLSHARMSADDPISKLRGRAEALLAAFAPSAGMNERTARTYALRLDSLIRDYDQYSHDVGGWRETIAAQGGPRRRGHGTRLAETITKPEEPRDVVEVPRDFVVYVFQLRQSLTIKLPLPSDLSHTDVERLHRWMTTLPFGTPRSEAGSKRLEDDDIPF